MAAGQENYFRRNERARLSEKIEQMTTGRVPPETRCYGIECDEPGLEAQ